MPGRRTKLAAPGIPSRSHLGDRLFAASHSRGTKSRCSRTKVALGQDQQKTHVILDDNFLCLVPVRLLLSSTAVLYHVNG